MKVCTTVLLIRLGTCGIKTKSSLVSFVITNVNCHQFQECYSMFFSEGHLVICFQGCLLLKVEAKLFSNSFLSTLPEISVRLQNSLSELRKISF